MLGFLAVRAATGAVGGMTKNGVKPEEVKPTPAGPFAVVIVLALMAVVLIAAMANGGQVTWIITPLAVIAGLVILGGIFAGGAADAHRASQALRSMPNPEDKLHEAQSFRAAMERRAVTPALTRTAAGLEPAPVDARTAARPSLASFAADQADTERCVRMAHIMMAPCPTCTVEGGGFCNFHPGQEVTILDRERSVIVHTSRIGHAIKSRHANVEDVKAQFNGNIPASVWRYAL